MRRKEGRPLKPIETPTIYWESDKAKNEFLTNRAQYKQTVSSLEHIRKEI